MLVKFEVYYDGKYWCARGIGEDIFTQGKTLDELIKNMKEAVEVHFMDELEKGEEIRTITLKMMQILDITQAERVRCEEKQAEWIRSYIDSLPPMKPYAVIRVIPAVYMNSEIPQHLTEEEMVEHAVALAKRMHKQVCLQYSYAKRYWIDQKGDYVIDTKFHGGPSMSMDLSKIFTVDP